MNKKQGQHNTAQQYSTTQYSTTQPKCRSAYSGVPLESCDILSENGPKRVCLVRVFSFSHLKDVPLQSHMQISVSALLIFSVP